jgi:hypothetical protein
MRISTKNKSIALVVIGLISLAISAPSAVSAGATQADIDYSTKVSTLSQDFIKTTTDWGVAISSPPTFTIGSKWSKYKAGATKSANTVLASIAKLSALTPSAGFTKSDPLLKAACAAYKSAITAVNNGVQKNDAKMISKSMSLVTKANTALLAWSKAYQADVAALNG